MEKPIITTETIELTHKIEEGYDEKTIDIIHGDYQVNVQLCIDNNRGKSDAVSITLNPVNKHHQTTTIYFETQGGNNKVAISNHDLVGTDFRSDNEWIYVERIFNNLKNLKAFFKSI